MISVKIDMSKFNVSKLVPVALVGLGLLETVLSNKKQADERNALKNELRDEIMKEIVDKK